MTNWQRKPLSEVVLYWVKGATPKRNHYEYFSPDMGIPWAKVSDMQGKFLEETEEYLTDKGADQLIGQVEKGMLLLSVSGTIGKVAIAGSDMKINQAIQAMRFREDEVLTEYAYYYLLYFRPWLEEKANTVTIANLTKRQLERTCIIFPCLEEQRYIIERMNCAERLIEKQNHMFNLLKQVSFCVMYQHTEIFTCLPKLQKITEEQLENVMRPDVPEKIKDKYRQFVHRLSVLEKKILLQGQKMERLYQSLLAAAMHAWLTKKYRQEYGLEEPNASVLLRHYHVKAIERMEAAITVKDTGWLDGFGQIQRQFIGYLSPFQREILRIYVETEAPMPIHEMRKRLNQAEGMDVDRYSIQDAITAVKILEELGFLEGTIPEKIFLDQTELTDAHGKLITIQKYQSSALAGGGER